MSQLTIVLPHALPVPEFAPDLVRALQAPALAALVSRTNHASRAPADEAIRALPHELWLARTLDLLEHGRPAVASAAMGAHGVAADAGTWFVVQPVHIEIARTHLMMGDPDALGLLEADSRALFESARPLFEARGHALAYGDAATWFMRADDWAGLDTATVEAALGMDLTDWMPLGAQAAAFRRLQNEVQIEWHAHPVNAAREARRLPAVNGFWLWGGADASRRRAPGMRLATMDTAPWLAALADVRVGDPAVLASEPAGDTVLVCGSVAPYARAADWGGWVAQMQSLEAGLFAPILASLMAGRLRRVSLVLGHRDALAEFTTNALAQRKFWRRPTLDRLL